MAGAGESRHARTPPSRVDGRSAWPRGFPAALMLQASNRERGSFDGDAGTPRDAASVTIFLMARYMIAQLDQLPPTRCPCGDARRAFGTADNPTATVHLVDILADARVHYHKRLTEIYVILEGEGHLELDGERVPVRPLTAVFIRPGC